MRVALYLIVYISFFIIAGSEIPLNAQISKESKAISSYLKISKLIKKTGWELPKKDELLINSIDQIEFDSFSISVKNLNLKKDFETEYQEYFLKDDNSLAIRSFNTKMIGINSYELKGKIFAYRALYAPILTSVDGSRTIAGMVFIVYYYDEDGDSVFETLYTNKQSIDYLPDWVKK